MRTSVKYQGIKRKETVRRAHWRRLQSCLDPAEHLVKLLDKLAHLRQWAFIVTDDPPSPPEAEAAKANRPTCYARPLARSAFLAPPSERTDQPLETARWRMRSGSCAAFGSGSPTRQRERDAERRAALSASTYTFMSKLEMLRWCTFSCLFQCGLMHVCLTHGPVIGRKNVIPPCEQRCPCQEMKI